jgi:hypothetical protein
MIHWSLFYCSWTLMWSLLYLMNIITSSPLFSLIIIAFITSINLCLFFPYIKIELKILCILSEILIMILIYYNTINFNIRDIYINILFCICYILYINYKKKTLYEVYYIDFYNDATKYNTIYKYLNARYESL